MACEKILLNVSTLDKHGFTASNQAIVISKGFIEWCGDEDKIPEQFVQSVMAKENCNGNLITPGLIDCHTHLVYAGTRASEFKSKLQGKRYDEIANAGGGIASTVAHTRAASEDMLVSQSLPRLKALIREGVTTVEIKSGYGLDLNNELKMLRVARKLATLTDIRIKTTFLGAHAIPPEFIGRNQAYVDFLCQEMLPTVQESGLADAVDVFCESIGFTLQQSEQIFSAAQRLKMPIKCHAEQLSNIGASKLAAHYGALSNNHLEYLDEDGIQAMAQANTVAVLLPGAFYYLREKKLPPIAMLRKAGVGIAIATDCNPGSSPTTSLLLMMNMACLLFGMSVEETLSAVTYQAARALGLQDQVGVIAPGKVADMVLWSLKDSAELCCHFGYPILHKTMRAGQWITDYDSTDAGVI